MGDRVVTTVVEDRVAIISIDDGKMNAFTHDVLDAINAGLDTALAEAGAVLLRGNAKAFSAGFDLKVMQGGDGAAVMNLVNAGAELILRVYVHPQPTVAAVTGHALAAGALLALACDTRIGVLGASTKMGLNETQIGMSLPEFAYELARERLSKRYLTRATVQAELFSPDAAVEAGYLDRVATDCGAAALADARALAALPVAAYAGTKTSLRQPMVDRLLANIRR